MGSALPLVKLYCFLTKQLPRTHEQHMPLVARGGTVVAAAGAAEVWWQ